MCFYGYIDHLYFFFGKVSIQATSPFLNLDCLVFWGGLVCVLSVLCKFWILTFYQMYYWWECSLIQWVVFSFCRWFPMLCKTFLVCPWQVAQLIGASSHTPKSCRFGPKSRHIPTLKLWSPVGTLRVSSGLFLFKMVGLVWDHCLLIWILFSENLGKHIHVVYSWKEATLQLSNSKKIYALEIWD